MMAAFAVLVLSNFAAWAAAEEFLKSRSDLVNKEEVRQLLLNELAGRKDHAKLHEIEAYLQPLFASLPKNTLGRLDAPLVRYALHRYFVQKNGWHVKGLDTAWFNNETSSPTTVLKARAPAYIQSLFEEHLHGRGFGLHELAVFAATLADLIHAEAIGKLEAIHRVKGLPTTGLVQMPTEEADSAIDSFLVSYLLIGVNREAESIADLEWFKKRLYQQYPDFGETEMWFKDFRQTYDLKISTHQNPFVAHAEPTFDNSVAVVLEFSHQFGSFQNLECHSLKRKLMDMENIGTGRVRLADFYSKALNGGWEFMESLQYLRNQGVLDETDPSRPSVVISNYMNSLTNCLTTSKYYAVCCMNECNALMSNLEGALEMPSAAPASIARIVSGMQSDTVDAPRNLSSTLLSRLDEIANYHAGSIPLHGRLFAQWMHHAYPRECQFPHLSGSVNALTQEEFARTVGVASLQASSAEMEAQVSWQNETSTMTSLPWTQIEEELGVDMYHTDQRRSCLSTLAAVAALASVVVPMYRTLRDGLSGSPQAKEKVASLMV